MNRKNQEFVQTEPYSEFAEIYDSVMNHVNFRAWSRFILDAAAPPYPRNILDLACGTGLLLKFFPTEAAKTGVDISSNMLKVAKVNCPDAVYIQSDIRSFRTSERYDLITCTHDSLNYFHGLEELENHFIMIRKMLSRGGLYFFDISSEYNLTENFHKKTIRHSEGNIFLEWENEYDPVRTQIISTLNFTKLTAYGVEKKTETHVQNFFSEKNVESALLKAGLSVKRKGSDFKTWTLEKKASLINYIVRSETF